MRIGFAIGMAFYGLGALAQDGLIPQDGLVAFYPFHGNAEDESVFDNHAEVNGATLVNDRFGASEEAYLFAANTDIVIPHADQIDMATGDTFSWAIWMLPSAEEMGGEGSVFEKWNNSGNSYPALQFRTIDVDGTCEIYSSAWCGGGGIGQVEGQIEWSAWTHVAMVAEDGVQSLFVNGQMVDQQEVQEYGCGNNVDITMGRRPGYGNPFRGAVDDFVIWNRALTSVEIINMHLGGEPEGAVYGCTDSESCNYNPDANLDDSSCHDLCQYCYDGTVWNEDVYACIPTDPSDYDADGCVGMTDLLDLLSVFGTCNETSWTCGDPIEYQGYDYETVQIGDQCWYAENCRFMPFVGGGFQEEPSILVYGYDGDSVEEAQQTLAYDMYGTLYNFASATQLGLCPPGWHVPSKIEFDELFANLGGIDQAHSQVMLEQAWNVGFDLADEGFSLLPAGWLYLSFAEAGESAYMWTSTPYGENDPRGYAWNIQELNQFQIVYEGASRSAGQSVRCLKDSE